MKKIKFIALTMILTMITFFTNAQRQERYSYGQEADNGIGVYIHAAVGVSPKFERAYELEIGAKGIDSRFFVCAVGKVYDANTDNDQRSHFYYGLRLNYVIYMSDLTAIGPMATYLRHSTGEAGRNMSNDWEAGLRFYRFSANPGASSAAWTVTFQYLSTQENIFDKGGASTLAPTNKFFLSLGIHGLFK